jgi:hypothetical protein
MRWLRLLGPLVIVLAAGGAPAGAASRAEAEGWLDRLYDAAAADLRAGRPLVIQVHVPLCSNDIIRCGNPRLGDGDSPRTNLYWSTSGGFGWFGRRGSGWTEVHRASGRGDVLETRIWRRSIAPGREWRARGVTRRFSVYVVALAWRGSAIRKAMDAYVTDLSGDTARTVKLGDGTAVRAGGAAHVVGFVGHNGWMDVADYDFAKVIRRAGGSARAKGHIALACATEPYLAADLVSAGRVPLLMTRSLLFAGAHAFEGAVTAFAQASSLQRIRLAAAENYARGQDKPLARVSPMFTNPAHALWRGK